MRSHLGTEVVFLQLMISGTICFVNLVHDQGLRGIANMGAPSQKNTWIAGKAIDGNTDQNYLSDSCAITDVVGNRNTSIWWKVWLEKKFNVAYIEIYFRSDTFERSTGFSIYTYIKQNFYPLTDPKHLVYHHYLQSGCPMSVMKVTVNNITQGITYINERPIGYTSNCQHDNKQYTGIEICEIRVMGCDLGRYSNRCTKTCPSKCNGACDAFNGSCIHGCSDPNALTIDCIVCTDKQYISNNVCIDCPGHCKDDAPCNKLTGMCDNGCANQWTGAFCNICLANFYGKDCNTTCGHCRGNDVCNNITGHCPNGCQSQWQGDRCDECVNGFYNSSCTGVCGHCSNSEFCDKVNGHCLNGCTSNFQAPLCQECVGGFYNRTCTGVCGHCVNGEVCLPDTGYCANGCSNHYLYPFCQVCKDGYYGDTCNINCGRCKDGHACDKHNGHCYSGCVPNFQQPKCEVCENGFYNANCTGRCGHCKSGHACNKENGNCLNGCSSNFQMPLCQECNIGFYGENCNKTCTNCNSSAPSCDRLYGHCLFGCEDGRKTTCCEPIEIKDNENDSTTGAVVGGVVSVLVVLVVVGVFGFIYRRRRGGEKDNHNNETSKPHTFHSKLSSKGKKYADFKDDLPNTSTGEYMNHTLPEDDGGYYNTAEVNTVIRVEDLQRVISEKSAGENNMFQSEYRRLPEGNTSVCKEGKKQENIVKNRFKTTFPYDHSRVILKDTWGDGDNDYINANFIKDFNGQRMYIAAQGPKNNTLTDFWRMIWQENVRFIVMLTNIVENGKNKCTQYWPTKDKPLEVGPCKMHLLKENVYAFHTFRKFTVQSTKSSAKRTITHFHYTAWPDHGTPEELGLVQFHKAVTRSYHPGGLMLVHCSAGVGRTGTFIGLDSLLKQGRETERINVFEFVKQMRQDRMTMVQTPEQYIFLHKVLLFGFQDKYTVIHESDIPTKLTELLQDSAPLNQTALYKEYKFLQTAKPVFEDDDKEDGMKPENKDKNSNMNVIPVSKYRPYLTSYVKGRTDYINAVCVPSFSNLSANILTQAPLQDTNVDLWTLCVDHDVKAIVILSDANEEIEWIPKKGCSCICAPYNLTSGETGSSISGVTQDKLLIQTDSTKQDVDVFHIPFENDNAMLKGVELLLEKGKVNEYTSVVISKDSAGPAGVFCVLHNALQQLRMDGEVDLLTTVRLIHTRRPEVITKMEEYRRCYELLLLSVSEDGIYANM
nr:receptor-type tyrosine-protein phosphatase T-like isoform X1 [Crassostrea gigas]